MFCFGILLWQKLWFTDRQDRLVVYSDCATLSLQEIELKKQNIALDKIHYRVDFDGFFSLAKNFFSSVFMSVIMVPILEVNPLFPKSTHSPKIRFLFNYPNF